jgi:PSP
VHVSARLLAYFFNFPLPCRESRHKLDELLHEWKSWHANRFPEGFRPPEVLSGTLRYEPNGVLSSLSESILPVLDDRPAPSMNPITRTMWFNVQYERTGEVPVYERAVDRPLKVQRAAKSKMSGQPQEPILASSSSSPLLNGDDNKLMEEGIAEPVSETTTNNGLVAYPGVAGSDSKVIVKSAGSGGGGGGGGGGPKRQRLGQRCFNCGSYAHSLRECWKEHNPEAIEDARRRLQGVTGGSGGPGSAPRRYFLIDEQGREQKEKKKKTQQKEDNSSEPKSSSGSSSLEKEEEEDGELDESLDEENLTAFEKLQREFLLAAPGHLSSSLREALGIGALDAPPWLHTMRAMGLPPAYIPRPAAVAKVKMEEIEEAPPPPPPPSLEQVVEQGKEGFMLPVIVDKKGVSSAIINTANLAAQVPTKEEVEDFIQLPVEGEEDEESDEDKEESSRDKDVSRKEVFFPGVNAPIPEGADPRQWEEGGHHHHQYQYPYHHSHQQQPPPPHQQPPQPPPVVPMYSALPSHAPAGPAPGQYSPPPSTSPSHDYYHAQHSYYHQDQQQYEYYPYNAAATAPPASYYRHQGDYSHHYQQQAPPGGYYNPPPPSSFSVLPYQPPPPANQQHPTQHYFSPIPNPNPPPPPPPSDAGY